MAGFHVWYGLGTSEHHLCIRWRSVSVRTCPLGSGAQRGGLGGGREEGRERKGGNEGEREEGHKGGRGRERGREVHVGEE